MRPTEPNESDNGEVAAVFEARECCERGASWMAEVVQMLGATVRYVKTESIKTSTVMAWSV